VYRVIYALTKPCSRRCAELSPIDFDDGPDRSRHARGGQEWGSQADSRKQGYQRDCQYLRRSNETRQMIYAARKSSRSRLNVTRIASTGRERIGR